MKIHPAVFFSLMLLCSCKLPTDSGTKYATDKVYRLHLKPSVGSAYHYAVTTNTETKMEVNGQAVESVNNTDAGVTYSVNADSAGNYLLHIAYDKLHVYSKNGDKESDADAENAKLSINPTEKMLGIVKDASLTGTVTPTGEVKEISGYKELSAQLMENLDTDDPNARQMAQAELDKVIRSEMIQKNLTQLFTIFPDSAIYIGDEWKINSEQSSDFHLKVSSVYRLDYITDNIAFVKSHSKIEGEHTPLAMMGYSVMPDLKGTQTANYEIEATTGMLLKSNIESEVGGSLTMAGREVPLTIKTKVNIEGKKVK